MAAPTSQQDGLPRGAAAERIVEGPELVRKSGPVDPWDTPHYPGDNDFDDVIAAGDTGYHPYTVGAAPRSKDQDTVG